MPRSRSLKLWNSSITTARDVGEIERFAMQQPVEENLGHDDQHPGVGILAAVAGHQPDVVGGSKPQRTAAFCISRNFCSVSAISGVV